LSLGKLVPVGILTKKPSTSISGGSSRLALAYKKHIKEDIDKKYKEKEELYFDCLKEK